MGLRKIYVDHINKCISITLGELSGLKMLEFGNQRLRGIRPEKTGKEYYENRGVLHTSIDLNGKDGALKLDLTKPDQFSDWHNYFDVITDSGTTEHIEPLESQYDCFSIVHDCLKVGGIAIHLLPDADALEKLGEEYRYKPHCNNFYSDEFFVWLADSSGYDVISIVRLRDIVCCCLHKVSNGHFTKDRDGLIGMIKREENRVY